jgi:hypothetical protein
VTPYWQIMCILHIDSYSASWFVPFVNNPTGLRWKCAVANYAHEQVPSVFLSRKRSEVPCPVHTSVFDTNALCHNSRQTSASDIFQM